MKDIGPSEYEGRGTEHAGGFEKPASTLNNGDRLRLGYLTGQQTDETVPVDPAIFRGAVTPEAETPSDRDLQDFST